MWYRLATIISDQQLQSELQNNATSSDDIKSNYRMLARKYHPDVNQDPDSTENFKNLTRVYEEIKDRPILFHRKTGEKRTTSDEVKEYLEDSSDIKDAIGILVSTYFVRNVPEEYDTPDYTVDEAITEKILEQTEGLDKPYDNIAYLINLYCGKYIKENY